MMSVHAFPNAAQRPARSARASSLLASSARHRRSRRRATPTAEALETRLVLSWPTVAQALSGNASTVLSGVVYDDLDANGKKTPGENGIKGWTVYIDLDHSGTLNTDANGVPEPTSVTNIDGIYTFSKLVPDTYRVSQVVQPGWEATSPASQDLTAVLNRTVKADFFDFSGGAIDGTVWNDLNADGIRDTGPGGEFTDPGLPGWTVFLDLDNNRFLDAGEPSTVTDTNGFYHFENLPEGDYEVTEIKPADWDVSPGYDIKQTAAVVPRSTFHQDFANFSLTSGSLDGVIWNDLNNDGVRATGPGGEFTDPGLEGWTVFLDQNNNGLLDSGEASTLTDANGQYSFISLPEGSYEVTELLPLGWSPATTFDVSQTVDVFPGEASAAGDFANFSVLNGAVQGTVWNDLNRNGVRDSGLSGAFSDPGLAGWTILLDRNGNGVADPGEPTTLTDSAGNYQFSDLQIGDYDIREILPAGWETTVGFDDNYTVSVFSGAVSAVHDFANFNIATATAGTVSGTVWNDQNGNGVREPSTDLGLAGWDVFVDLNSNGVRDGSEPGATTGPDGSYTIAGVLPGTVTVVEVVKAGWTATAPLSHARTIALRNGENATGLDFGNYTRKDGSILGTVFADANRNGVRDAGEKGLADVVVYLDLNDNSALDAGEPSTTTSADQFFTPALDESGTYSFTHLASGTYVVRTALPAALSATPAAELAHTVTLSAAGSVAVVDTAAVYRPNEIHGVDYQDLNGDHARNPGEPPIVGAKVYIDLNRNDAHDPGEPTTVTGADGSYTFKDLGPGAYVVREVLAPGSTRSFPLTGGGVLWPAGTSNPAVGNVSPTRITTALAVGQSYRQTVSLTLPGTGSLSNMVDVFLLFDDTGSFVNNSPIVRGAFPTIISSLQASLPGVDLGFGVGRFEEYANFAAEYATGRPFVLNQPIVASGTTNFMASIQAALDRTTPGYGGDQPETDIEALYQLVTGLGFDGNNNGTVLDSAAGLVSTQLTPGSSGDVPSFASFKADPSGSVLAAAGNVGGGGFRAGALPIILLATDTGFAYQPKGETTIAGAGGVTLPLSSFLQTSRNTTPFGNGAGIQETITALNALGALVIGLGTNSQTNIDPRQGLSAISTLTGAINRSSTPIANGTGSPINPGDPLYFQIASGFAASVADGVTSAIRNAVTTVAMDVTLQSSDPRVKIVNHTGIQHGVGAGQTASFDVEFVGDGVPHRFDLQFVRNGTNVVLGSIPVVLGTPITGEGYEFEDLEDGAIGTSADFASQTSTSTTTTPTITVTGGTFTYDTFTHAATATASGAGGVVVPGTFTFTYNGASAAPVDAGSYNVVASFKSADPNYSDATGTATITVQAASPTLTVNGGTFTFDALAHGASAKALGVGGSSVFGTFTFTYNGSSTAPAGAGVYNVSAAFTSSDPNYQNATGTATITINAAPPAVVVNGGTFRYDTLAHGATATATGVGGTAVAGTFTFTYNGDAGLPVNVGVYNVAASFVSSDPNYQSASGTATITISHGLLTLSLAGGPFPYDGQTHGAGGTAVNAQGAAVSGAWTYRYSQGGLPASPVDAGTYDVSATFVADDPGYGTATATTTLVISRVTPAFSNLSSPSIMSGTANVLLSGRIAAGAVAPQGGTVSIGVNGSTRSASVDASGDFSVNFPTAGLVAADYTVTYHFAGDANFNPAADGFSLLTVTPRAVAGATTTSLTSSIPVSVPGQYLTYTSTVSTTDIAAGTPTGTVTFRDGTAVLGTVVLVNGSASISVRPFALGTHAVTATYAGDGGHLPSAGAFSQVLRSVVLQPTAASGRFVLAVAGAAGRDTLQVEVDRTKSRDTYVVEIDAQGGPGGDFSYFEAANVAGRVSKVLIFGIGIDENVELNTNGSAIPATFVGGPGANTFSGGDGDNIAVGGAGANDLRGGPGHAILIAGRGKSSLRAGSGETILIGGTTAYDEPTEANLLALDQIMGEWSSAAPLATRAAHLAGAEAGGLNGTFLLNGSTVHDNGVADTLTGGSGNDWFFANIVQDVVKSAR
ncbi:MAG: SdrD B-like domain-containing protein [Isosphaeraceae bacterium]